MSATLTDEPNFDGSVKVPAVNSDAFTQRLRKIIGTESVRKFARRAGLNPGTLQSILTRGTATLENLVAIAQAGGVSVGWLATGAEPANRPGLAEEPAAFRPAAGLGDDFVLLPKYDVRAAAGGGAVIHSEQIVDYLAFKASWVYQRLGAQPKNLILLESWGDSMEPTIADGDLLLVDRSRAQVRDNAIYAFAADGNLMVKRLQRRIATGHLIVISDNPRYAPEELGPGVPLNVIGQVIWHGGLV